MLMAIMVGLVFLMSEHPVVNVFCLIMMVLFYGILMAKSMSVMWFSLMVMLVMLSGVLVLMIYMASLVPNEEFGYWGWWVGGGVLLLGEGWTGNMGWGSDGSVEVAKMWGGVMGYVNLVLLVFLFMIMLGVVWVSQSFDGAVSVECES